MIVELIVVTIVIGILAGLIFIGVTDSQARARNTERAADIDTLHSRLEEYRTDRGGYPETLSAELFPGLNPEVLVDPRGQDIDIRTPVATQADALDTEDPDGTGPDYIYVAYPEGCGGITCRGYILKSFIENPADKLPSPYVRGGLHNN
jgi:type II secretory pathway pseudopilin PulG